MEDISMPLVSILMAAYNTQNYISEAIDSVVNQTYVNWELIICDDCSQDGTYEVCKNYEKKDKRIKVIKNKINSGQATARNNAFLKSRGEYIAILDSDDFFSTDKIEKQINFILNHKEFAFVGCNSTMFNEWEGEYGFIKKELIPKPEIVLKNKGFVYASILVRRNVFKLINGYTVSSITRTGEDYDLVCKMYLNGYKGANIQENLYHYRVQNENYNRRKYRCYYSEFRIAMKHVREGWLLKNEVSKKIIIHLFFPLIKGLIPTPLMKMYHKKRFEKEE